MYLVLVDAMDRSLASKIKKKNNDTLYHQIQDLNLGFFFDIFLDPREKSLKKLHYYFGRKNVFQKSFWFLLTFSRYFTKTHSNASFLFVT